MYIFEFNLILFFHIILKNFPSIQNSISQHEQKPTTSFQKVSSNEETLNKYQKSYDVPVWSTLHSAKSSSQQITVRNSLEPFRRADISTPSPFIASNDLKIASSQDSRRSVNDIHFEDEKLEPKPLIIEYQPPFVYPIYNENYTKSTANVVNTNQVFYTRFPSRTSTPTPLSEIESNSNSIDFVHSNNNYVDNNKFSVVNLIKGRIFTKPNVMPTESTSMVLLSGVQAAIPSENSISISSGFAPIANNLNNYPEPLSGLIPPYETFHIYDESTTQGPPIYYEWKIPASGLEPPHLDDQNRESITMEDNQIPVIPPETIKPSIPIPILEKELVPPIYETSSSLFNQVKVPAIGLQPPNLSPTLPQLTDTQFLVTNHSFPSIASINAELQKNSKDVLLINDKSQTPRSVATGQNQRNLVTSTTKRQSETTTKDLNYLDLKKLFLIPEYTFPLETVQRPGYEHDNAVNSFQIKIPDPQDDEGQTKPWYGENAKCPECHPSFLKPGSCEPCIKLR